jgi:hypothetical protein
MERDTVAAQAVRATPVICGAAVLLLWHRIQVSRRGASQLEKGMERWEGECACEGEWVKVRVEVCRWRKVK